jgi:hypothetical protein
MIAGGNARVTKIFGRLWSTIASLRARGIMPQPGRKAKLGTAIAWLSQQACPTQRRQAV